MKKFALLILSLLLSSWLLASGSPIIQAAPASATLPDAQAYLNEFLLQTITPPKRDEYAVYARLKNGGKSVGAERTTNSKPYALGDQDTFSVFDLERKNFYDIRATLVAVTPHVYMFLDNGFNLDKGVLGRVAQAFEDKVYPTTRQYFGEEWSPGVDGDPHVVILNTPLRGAAGYFSSDDELLRSVNPRSNQREIFFMSARPENTDSYLSILAHEFQHMIHYRNQANQENWLNEGSSVLSQTLNGYSSGGYAAQFLAQPGTTQLNTWTCSSCGLSRYYGSSYMWMAYVEERFGIEFVRDLIANGQGLTAFNAVDFALFKKFGPTAPTYAEVFKDWVTANYLNRTTADPLYGYKREGGRAAGSGSITNFPTTLKPTVSQFAASYYTVEAGNGGFTLNFQGQPTVSLVNAPDKGGKMAWWSNRGDGGDTSLTREFDLSKASGAIKLNFSAWWDIEALYDLLYFEVSSDGGQSWQVVPGKYTTNSNTGSKIYGPGLTGHSRTSSPDLEDSSKTEAEWVQESVDLSAFAGKKIQFRLNYLTDEGYSRQGALFDNFELPAIGWRDDIESDSGEWQSQGFVRVSNSLPQHYAVRIIRQDGACGNSGTTDLTKADNGASCITDLKLDGSNTASIKVPYSKAIVVLAPYAAKTLVPSSFSVTISK